MYVHMYVFCFLGPHPMHVEVPRLGAQLELQLPAYTTATATSDPSHLCDLHDSSQQCRILNPLNEATDGTWNLMVPSQICFLCATIGSPIYLFFIQGYNQPHLSYIWILKYIQSHLHWVRIIWNLFSYMFLFNNCHVILRHGDFQTCMWYVVYIEKDLNRRINIYFYIIHRKTVTKKFLIKNLKFSPSLLFPNLEYASIFILSS